jgi:23S rRNA pseudouridine2457 synthase
VQVEGQITKAALELLQSGIDIVVDGKTYHTKKSIAEVFATDPDVEGRNPPVRFRKNIPTSWIKLIITEGKNRQVRKMTAKAGFPTLRLIRHRIGKVTLEGLKPGSIKELTRDELSTLLFLA